MNKTAIKRQATRLFNRGNVGQIIEFKVGDEMVGSYEIPFNHYVEHDAKTVSEWVNGCFFFIEFKGITGDISLNLK